MILKLLQKQPWECNFLSKLTIENFTILTEFHESILHFKTVMKIIITISSILNLQGYALLEHHHSMKRKAQHSGLHSSKLISTQVDEEEVLSRQLEENLA